MLTEPNLEKAYRQVKEYVVNSGYRKEIEWQENRNFSDTTESDFLREGAWVIVNSGMRESVVRKFFRDLSLCFFEWESAKKICEAECFCFEAAIKVFNNNRKIAAIISMAAQVFNIGFKRLKERLSNAPIEYLQTFQYIGPVTSYHLAKNLGLQVAKPDRHLVRLSNFLQFENVQQLCSVIAQHTGDAISVVDIVLWRFATLEKKYLATFLRLAE